jgi:hypothetical protein
MLGLPHWLMLAGAILTLTGFIGLALSRNKEIVEADPGSPANTSPAAAERAGNLKSEH